MHWTNCLSLCFWLVPFRGKILLKPHPDWHLLGVLLKFPDKHPRPFYVGAPPPGPLTRHSDLPLWPVCLEGYFYPRLSIKNFWREDGINFSWHYQSMMSVIGECQQDSPQKACGNQCQRGGDLHNNAFNLLHNDINLHNNKNLVK